MRHLFNFCAWLYSERYFGAIRLQENRLLMFRTRNATCTLWCSVQKQMENPMKFCMMTMNINKRHFDDQVNTNLSYGYLHTRRRCRAWC